MNENAKLKRQIFELDFAIYELVLFLDTHPKSRRAMRLLEEYRAKRKDLISLYEEKFGKYIVTLKDVPMADTWKWLDSPWPWDTDFMEG